MNDFDRAKLARLQLDLAARQAEADGLRALAVDLRDAAESARFNVARTYGLDASLSVDALAALTSEDLRRTFGGLVQRPTPEAVEHVERRFRADLARAIATRDRLESVRARQAAANAVLGPLRQLVDACEKRYGVIPL